ncbi:MAG: lactonase family protein [Planctomycetaceae bacterium]
MRGTSAAAESTAEPRRATLEPRDPRRMTTPTSNRRVPMPAAPPLLVLATMFAADPAAGIRAFHLDPVSGALAPAAVTGGCPNAFFLALAPDRRTVYALTAGRFGAADTEEVLAWRLADRDGRLEPLGRRPARGAATCFLATDPSGRTLLIAHYTGGTVATLPLAADGSLAGDPVPVRHTGSGPNQARQEGPHPHAIVAAPRVPGAPQFVFAADLGCDAIYGYRLDAATGGLVPLDPPFVHSRPGAGPRHLAFHPDGRRLYAINELDNTIACHDFDPATGRLVARQVVPTLPEGFRGENTTADVKLTPDGRFLYGTNRGHDSIAVFRVAADGLLEPVEIVPSRGAGPQHLAITPDGGLLLCANMPGDSIAVFRIDPDSGRLAPLGEPVPVSSPSCLVLP